MTLKDLIRKKGMTQKDLAQKVHKTQQAVSKWAKGLCAPNPTDCIKLASILGVTEREILECFTDGHQLSDDYIDKQYETKII